MRFVARKKQELGLKILNLECSPRMAIQSHLEPITGVSECVSAAGLLTEQHTTGLISNLSVLCNVA